MDWQKLVICGVLLSGVSSLHAEGLQEKESKEISHEKERKYIEKEIINLENSYIPALKHAMQLWVHLDFLYWMPKIRSMDYTTEKSNVLATDNFTSQPLVNSSFEWQPGFQVGMGYLFPRTHWDITFKGLHYHSSTHGKRSTYNDPLLGMFPIWSLAEDTLPGDYVTSAEIKGRLTFDRLNLHGGYFFQSSEHFVVRTWVGIESAFIKQHYDVEYSGGIFSSGTDYIHLKNNFWGIGPQVGIYPWVLLGRGWSFFGRASLSWLYGVFKVGQSETYLDAERYNKDHDLVKGSWSTDTEAGIQWKHPFYHNRFSFSTKLSWEYLVYFKQNQLTRDPYNKLHGGGIQMQGAVLSIVFDF